MTAAASIPVRATVPENPVRPTALFTPPRYPSGSDGKTSGPRLLSTAATSTASKGTLPFTGIQLWTLALFGLGLVGAGWTLRRQARARTQ